MAKIELAIQSGKSPKTVMSPIPIMAAVHITGTDFSRFIFHLHDIIHLPSASTALAGARMLLHRGRAPWSELYHTRRRWLSIAAVMAVAVLYAGIAWSSTGAAPAQDSPLPTPEAFIPTDYVFCPWVEKNGADTDEIEPTPVPIVLAACDNDECRGQLYRDMVSNTVVIVNPLASWASSGCECGYTSSRAQGTAVGTIMAMVLKIVGAIFSTIGNVIGQGMAMLFQFWGLVTAEAEDYSISCAADMELFCFGVAAVVALDDVGGGIIMTLTSLLISVASIYLILWVVSQVREIMQPGGGVE